MTKTKRQLRAEAVERLRNFESSDVGDGYYWDVMWSLLGKRPTEYDSSDELLSALIDLLTDDCDTECYECARLAELVAENSQLRVIVGDLNAPTDPGEASMMSVAAFIEKQTEHESLDTREKPWHERVDDYLATFDDSREKLEADAETIALLYAESVIHAGALLGEITKLLDRQAAITERHILTHPDERDEQIAELQREVDRHTRENMSLARDLGECMAERDGLRRENARLSGDEFYLRCTLVDMNGEVVG